ncbi:zf-HC2 domain-containing protein [Cellulomonas xiejunii]|uniref:Zf-HC2 domain-containing protein n=1 Tax=Cellulomonas xiejunii TaxID=2968083 RepID=A0ABY5KUL7_9CELL|nr:zf-HC2 domain-containing protein [Cellulomonas xiejunii]MCC2314475.1 zf-HC2 domain-containing protein [Cellulomonas xiejunii]MCC2322809.1 zf-HC2 domain-containing protein [Cellulomonas xiejunii]UUI72835.1 zf-HC2 domain-containing protein [Cellulomonas xiejunii]
MMHLGSRISALVDGQLDPAATERAFAHVATCPMCARELAAARAARQALAGAEPVLPTEDLTARLLSLSSQSGPPVPPAPGTRDPFAVGAGAALPVAATRALRGDVVTGRSPVRLVVGSVAGMSAMAAGLFMLGERPVVTPSSHPAAALGLLAHTSAPADAGDVPADDATVTWLRGKGWTFPADLPDGWQVRSIGWSSDDPDVLEVDVTGPGGSYVVTEQQGRLDTQALAGAPVREVGGRRVHVLSLEPCQVAWQSGSTVVQIIAAQDEDALDALVAAFPSAGYDDTVTGRIGRGWQTVSAVWGRP